MISLSTFKPARFALPALLLAGLLAPSFAAAQSGVKIATCNAARVFNEIQETKDLKAKMEDRRKSLEATETEKKTKLREAVQQRDQLKSDSPQWQDRNKEVLQLSIDLEIWGRTIQADVQRDQKGQMKGIFEKITFASAKVAQAKGIDLVVSEQRPEWPENIDQINVDQLRALINQRNVLYSSAQVDLTNDVIAQLDADYKVGR